MDGGRPNQRSRCEMSRRRERRRAFDGTRIHRRRAVGPAARAAPDARPGHPAAAAVVRGRPGPRSRRPGLAIGSGRDPAVRAVDRWPRPPAPGVDAATSISRPSGNPSAVATAHVLDSLSALPWLRDRGAERVLDLGSGGGYPGLPLAAAMPDAAFTLAEPIAKKARFLRTVVEATGLADRVTVLTARAEALAADPGRRGTWSVVTAGGGVDRRPRRALVPVAGPRRVARRLEARGPRP